MSDNSEDEKEDWELEYLTDLKKENDLLTAFDIFCKWFFKKNIPDRNCNLIIFNSKIFQNKKTKTYDDMLLLPLVSILALNSL